MPADHTPATANAAPAARRGRRRAVKATLAPAARGGARAAEKPAGPTPAQVAQWQSLGPDQRLALREREAVRLFAKGLGHHNKGELEDAAKAYGQALILDARIPDLYNNMGVALRALGKLEAAAACYRRSLVLRPDHAGAYTNLGNVLRQLGRLEVAAAAHRKAVELMPSSADAHYNLGLVLRDLGDTEGALECFARTLEVDPAHVTARWDRSLSLLQKGDYAGGFDEYEWRWKLAGDLARDFKQPLWDGAELKGKTILVHQEQGFGDMIQFARYLPMIKARGGNVVVEVQPQLARLFSTIEGVAQVINRGAALPKFDVYAPMLSLARIFKTTADTIPADVPYLKAPEAHAPGMPATLGTAKKIGIAWAGRPTHKNDANRSAAFTNFIDLCGLPQTTLYSLQTGPAVGDIADAGCEAFVLDVGSKLHDFADTAAVIGNLDLVISVDTAVAHLAGALGKPVWVALPYPGDWRWLEGRDDSPWYPTARLFRQRRPGAWGPVFERIRKALHDEVTAKGTARPAGD